MLHYESTITALSKFEAMHDTMMGNTVVENAKTTVIEISPDLPITLLERSSVLVWRFPSATLSRIESH
jgi:hypothetical protein